MVLVLVKDNNHSLIRFFVKFLVYIFIPLIVFALRMAVASQLFGEPRI
jgi:Na+/H+-dicarboxylate symporter